MIRLEPSLVMKYVEGLDAFVRFRIFSQDELQVVLRDASITNRRSYLDLVLAKCVVSLPDAARARLEQQTEKAEQLREVLYEVCIGLNPGLDIHKVILPVTEPGMEAGSAGLGMALGLLPEERPMGMKELARRLREQVVGQDEAVELVSAAVARAHAGLRDPNRPVATFLFVGQTGVGKTELAKSLSEMLGNGDRRSMVRIDCSEYSLPHEYAKLIGAPPGYVGHEQGGYLSSVMADANAEVVLFDEIEKADEKVHHLLLQIMDEGFVTDAKGVKIDFTDSIVVLTSNLGAQEAEALQHRLGFGMSARREALPHKQRVEATHEELRKRFKPEFLNRIDETVIFRSLGREDAGRILDKFAAQLDARARKQGLEVKLSPEAQGWLLERGFSAAFGARELRRSLQRHVETPLAHELVNGRLPRRGKVRVEVAGEGLTFVTLRRRSRTRRSSEPAASL
ncbi:MAG: ATP-dependent Clp protease ATP-binding subunit [Planctomycetes bacterium]|nr:ATP-dependent Clp protease ATP-binding subunit [Planctomycetota bacterium]